MMAEVFGFLPIMWQTEDSIAFCRPKPGPVLAVVGICDSETAGEKLTPSLSLYPISPAPLLSVSHS